MLPYASTYEGKAIAEYLTIHLILLNFVCILLFVTIYYGHVHFRMMSILLSNGLSHNKVSSLCLPAPLARDHAYEVSR